jgi:hypothetical protein
MAATPSNVPTNRAIDRLRKAVNLELTKKVVKLGDGSNFEIWCTPLVMAEREKAQKAVKDGDSNAMTLSLLITKAMDENGNPLFKQGEIDILKNEVRDSDLNKLMLAVISDESEAIDVKN